MSTERRTNTTITYFLGPGQFGWVLGAGFEAFRGVNPGGIQGILGRGYAEVQ